MSTNALLDTHGLVPHNTYGIGKKFSRLTILAIGKKQGSYRYMAVCSCECGNQSFVARLDKIKSGHTQSCGCLHAVSVKTHGCWGQPIFHIWSAIKRRCENEKDSHYKYYGARGIKLCEHWQDPNNFIDDMFPTYKKGLQIDRINNNGNYEPNNCRWATRSEQANNKVNSLLFDINNETKTLAQWCEIYKIKYQLAWERITVQGWEPLRALTEKTQLNQ